MVYCHVGELHYYTSLITASKTFYSGIVKDLVSKLAARTHIVTKFFSGSYSVLSMFLHFLDDFSNVFSSNPNRCIIGEINLLFWYFSLHPIIGTSKWHFRQIILDWWLSPYLGTYMCSINLIGWICKVFLIYTERVVRTQNFDFGVVEEGITGKFPRYI